jgi:cell division protein FtsI (penicillin-binding protein 3)
MTDYSPKKPNFTKWIRFRICLVGIFLGLCFATIVARAVQLQILDGGELSQKAAEQYKKAFHDRARRGTIFDRNHRELAISVDVSSICAYPKQISDLEQTASTLAQALNLEKSCLVEKLSSDNGFVWVKRHASPREVSAVKALKPAGIDFVTESRRFYPMKTLAAQVIGFCGTDGRGLEGLEYHYDSFLSGHESSWTVLKDALGRSFTVGDAVAEARDGYNLILTIDKNIQYIAEQALSEGVEDFSANSGMVVVMVPSTGAILAMGHVPQFNPNAFERYEPWLWRNRTITDSFEPGSTFKIFLASAALESGLCTPDAEFYCENGGYRVGKHVVHDVHAHGNLSLKDIVKYSSNIGAAKVGERIGSEFFFDKLKAFGFGARTGIDCPGETRGGLLPVDRWSQMDAAAICFGQAIAVSALQLATAVCAIANDGVLMKPYLVQAVTDRQGHIVSSFQPTVLRQVISTQTAQSLNSVLQSAVEKGGTGVRAALKGYRVAGKTGTAQKASPSGKGYARDRHMASFIGFVPPEDPEIVILVVIDEPRKHYYGGVVAAPVFRRIAMETLQYLKIPPGSVTPGVRKKSLSASREVGPVG